MRSETSDPILIARDLNVIFSSGEGGLHALNKISFAMVPEEFVCVLGPSGSGKSTLLRVMSGLLPPTQGEVIFEGEPLTRPRRRLGFVFQKSNLMPWRTVLENVQLPLELGPMGARPAGRIAEDLVELVGLQGFEDTLPRDLSGGMAQRVAIARALAHDPDILLLDEPFGSLDALTRDRMGEELLRIWQARRKTVLMVTHSISEAVYLADRVLVLSPRPGQVVLDLAIPLPRPRTEAMRYTLEFGDIARQLRETIRA
jgi:NitT/TauT family transport system ATP-binding protein